MFRTAVLIAAVFLTMDSASAVAQQGTPLGSPVPEIDQGPGATRAWQEYYGAVSSIRPPSSSTNAPWFAPPYAQQLSGPCRAALTASQGARSALSEKLDELCAAQIDFDLEALKKLGADSDEHHRQALIMFVAVHALLAIAVTFSIVEMVLAWSLRRGREEKTEVRVSLEKISLATRSRALLFLLTTLVFYWLFLKFVFPLQVVRL